jgi:hypothetical protein
VEYLTDCRRLKILDGAVVVYAGAAPGEHLDILIEMFPTVKRWILYDSTASTVRSSKASVRGPGKAGFVTDDTARALRVELRDEAVLFISDIRTRPDEASVAKEMRDQARWGVHLRARAMLLKFRLPYVDLDGRYLKPDAKPPDFALDPADAALLKRPARGAAATRACFEGVHSSSDVLYLKGAVQLQVFAPPTSTEARLFVLADRAGKYALTHYDPVMYESCMNDFNDSARAATCTCTATRRRRRCSSRDTTAGGSA